MRGFGSNNDVLISSHSNNGYLFFLYHSFFWLCGKWRLCLYQLIPRGLKPILMAAKQCGILLHWEKSTAIAFLASVYVSKKWEVPLSRRYKYKKWYHLYLVKHFHCAGKANYPFFCWIIHRSKKISFSLLRNPSLSLPILLSTEPPISLPTHSYLYLATNLSTYIVFALPSHTSFYLPILLSTEPPIFLSTHPSHYRATHLCTYPSFSLPSHPSLSLPILISTKSPIYLPSLPSFYRATHISPYPSFYLSSLPSFYLPILLSTYPSLSLPNHPPLYLHGPSLYRATLLLPTLPSLYLVAHLFPYQSFSLPSHPSLYLLILLCLEPPISLFSTHLYFFLAT